MVRRNEENCMEFKETYKQIGFKNNYHKTEYLKVGETREEDTEL